MIISKLTVEDGRAIQTLEGVLKTAVLTGIKPAECAAVASAVAWFAGLMKQYGNVWVAEAKEREAPAAPIPSVPPAAEPAAPLKIKSYHPGKVK